MGEFAVENRVTPPRLLPQGLKLPLTFAQILIYSFPIRHVEGQSAEDLLEAQGGEGFGNPSGDSPLRNAQTTESKVTRAPLTK